MNLQKTIWCLLTVLFVFPLRAAEPEVDFAVGVLCPKGHKFYRFEGEVILAVSGNPLPEEIESVRKAVAIFNGICAGLPTRITMRDEDKNAHVQLDFRTGNRAVNVNWQWVGLMRTRAQVTFSRERSHYGLLAVPANLILEKLLKAMGMTGTAAKVAVPGKSIWGPHSYNEPPLEHPTKWDCALIRYAYEQVPSGTPPWKLRQMVRKNFPVP